MRVAFWSHFFWPNIGGSEMFAAHLLPELVRRGHEAMVFTAQGSAPLPAEDRFSGIEIRRYPLHRVLEEHDLNTLAAVSLEITEATRAFAPHVFHLNSLGPLDFLFRQARRARRAPHVVTLQQKFPKGMLGPGTLPGTTLRTAGWVVGCSASMLRDAVDSAPEVSARSSVIHPAILGPEQEPAPPRFDPPRLLCLGRLLRMKGFDVALRAFATVRRRFPASRLVVAGDGPELGNLRREAERLLPAGAVDFLGWVSPDAVPALLDGATVAVMPSRWEGLPCVAIETALMGRAIVASRAGGLPEAIVDGRTGLLTEPEDVEALALAITSLLDDPARTREMGRAARAFALETFGVSRCADRYEDVYRRAACSGAPEAGGQ